MLRTTSDKGVSELNYHTDYSCYDRSNFIYMKGSKLKMYKRLGL